MSQQAWNERCREVRFRSNPRYEIVVEDRIPAEERGRLGLTAGIPDLYGIARARDGSLRSLLLNRETALLLWTMREPDTLPSYLWTRKGVDGEIQRLVLDGALEMEADGGDFVSGTRAIATLSWNGPEAGGYLKRLSHDAIRYAAALHLTSPVLTSERLYAYGRIPSSAQSETASPAKLGDRIDRALPAGWHRSGISGGPWISWANSSRAGRPAQRGLPYKLYLSPMPEAVPHAIDRMVPALEGAECSSFKIGVGEPGLNRPDKIVLYFASFEALGMASTELRRALGGVAAHGVPFTAAATQDGLLSWGFDPQDEGTGERTSWRWWICQRLATALHLAPPSTNVEDVLSLALARLRTDGVDTQTWAPEPDFCSKQNGADPEMLT